MRYDERVKVVNRSQGTYNPDTGKKEPTDSVLYDNIPCNINPLSPARAQASFGDVYKDITVIRVQRSNAESLASATHALLNGRTYTIVKVIEYRHDIAIYAEELK